MFLAQVLLNSLVLSTQVLLLAAALYLIYAVSSIFYIALAAIFTVGGYAFYALTSAGVSFFYSTVIALAVTVMVGLISYLIMANFAREKMPLPGLLVSMGIWFFLESAIAIIFGSEGKFIVGGVLKTYSFDSLYLTAVGLWTLIIGGMMVIAAFVVTQYLPAGRMLRAVKQHSFCAQIIGIREKKVQILVFAAASLISGVMGILTGLNSALTPLMGHNFIMIAFIALLVGGANSFKGVIVATLILVLTSELLLSVNGVSASLKMFLIFALAFGLLIWRPAGIFTANSRRT